MRFEHSHQTLCRTMRDFAQSWESDCGVDEIAKDNLSGFNITRQKVFNPLAQKRLTKNPDRVERAPGWFLDNAVSTSLLISPRQRSRACGPELLTAPGSVEP
jgi:hypothetical protein